MRIKILETKQVISEITVDDVMQTLDGKKTTKRIANILQQEYPEIYEFSSEEKRDAILKRAHARLGAFIRKMVPRDITDAQAGAAANWAKNLLLNVRHDALFTNFQDQIDIDIIIIRLKRIIERFFQAHEFVPQAGFSKDINSYKTELALQIAADSAMHFFREKQKEKDYKDSSKGTDVIYDGPEWTIVIPRNKGAACEWGKGTEWCTAAPGLDFYEQYHSDDDPLYIFVNKKNPDERYQFHYGSEQFMDRDDEEIYGSSLFIKLHKLLTTKANIPAVAQSKIDESFNTDRFGNMSVKKEGFYAQYSRSSLTYHSKWSWVSVSEDPKYRKKLGNFGGTSKIGGPAEIEIAVDTPWAYSNRESKAFEFLVCRIQWIVFNNVVASIYLNESLKKINKEKLNTVEAMFSKHADGEWVKSFKKNKDVLDLQEWLQELLASKGYDRKTPREYVLRDFKDFIFSSESPLREWIDHIEDKIQKLLDMGDDSPLFANDYMQTMKPDEVSPPLYENELLNEVSLSDVLLTIDGKKTKKKLFNAYKQLTQTGDEEYDREQFEKNLEKIVKRFKHFVEKATPEDVTGAQKGAAANWVKNMCLSDPRNMSFIVLPTRGTAARTELSGARTFFQRVANNLELFFQWQDLIDTDKFPKDINAIKKFGDLFYIVDQTRPIFQAKQKEKDYKDAEKGKQVVYDGPEWTIIIPTNKGAACELGKDTDWCTAAPGLDFYEQYHSEDNPLFVFVHKNDPGTKYQFHYGTKQFMDTNDRRVKTNVFVKLHKLLLQADLPEEVRKNIDIIEENADGTVSKRESDEYEDAIVGDLVWYQNYTDIETGSPNRERGPARSQIKVLDGYSSATFIFKFEWRLYEELVAKLTYSPPTTSDEIFEGVIKRFGVMKRDEFTKEYSYWFEKYDFGDLSEEIAVINQKNKTYDLKSIQQDVFKIIHTKPEIKNFFRKANELTMHYAKTQEMGIYGNRVPHWREKDTELSADVLRESKRRLKIIISEKKNG